MKTANTATIDALNARARELHAAGCATRYAIEHAAREGLFFLVDGSVSPANHEYPIALFINEDGDHVNAWLAGPDGEEIADGAAGFDDQTNLHES